MLSQDQHDSLVERLYASALGDVPWSSTLGDIASRFGASKALLQVKDIDGGLAGFDMHGISLAFAAEFYAGEIYNGDPRVPLFAKVAPGNVYFDRALFDLEEMDNDPRCRACNDALGVKYSLGVVARLSRGAVASLALLSSPGEGHATDSAIRAFRGLAPHIEHALALGQIADQRAATQAALLGALTHKADDVMLLDRSGAPSFMNDSARVILAAGDGLSFARGAFATRRGAETRCLQRLIGTAIAPAAPSDPGLGAEMLVTRPSGKRPYVLRVIRATKTERFLTAASIACVIHLHDLARVCAPSKALLMAAFGLTERETDLARELVCCAGLSGAAANAGMALNTARNHLQGIFRKSATRTQAEAVQLFSRLG